MSDEINIGTLDISVLVNKKIYQAYLMGKNKGRADAITELIDKYLDADAYNEGIADGRADAIDAFYAKCREKYWFSSDFMNFFDEVREQLKEQTNE